MTFGKRVNFEPVREVAFGGIGAAYAALGGPTIDYPRIFSIYNTTNTDVYISLNATTNHMRIPAASSIVRDLTTNKVRDDGFFIPKGTTFYQKRAGAAPAAGNVWIEVIYADGGT